MPYSPACGMVWKTHFNSPVRTSNARTSPRMSSLVKNVSPIDWPITIVSRTTVGAPPQR